MGLFDGIIKAFGGGSASGAGTVERNTRMVYIIDGDRINEGRGTPGPAERAGLLQRLAQFAQREQITVQVVLGGRPLREAAHGDEFNGIKVYYAEQGGGMAEQIGALYSKAGSSVLVITSDREVEQKIDSLGGAGNRMKGSTLRKALEGESGGGEEGRDRRRDRGGRGGDRGERRDRREPREPREPREDRNESRPATESDAGEDVSSSDADSAGSDDANDARDSRDGRRNGPSGQTSVKNLIDLVE